MYYLIYGDGKAGRYPPLVWPVAVGALRGIPLPHGYLISDFRLL